MGKETQILNWLISEVEGVKYWIIKGGIYLDNDLENDLYPNLTVELKEKIIENAKPNTL